MGKERNPKKGNREDEADDELGSVRSRTSDDMPMKGKKKGRVEDEDSSKKIDGKNDKGKEGGKKKKEKKKGKGASARDSDENEDVVTHKVDSDEEETRNENVKKTQKKKQKARAVIDDDDDDDEFVIRKPTSKKSEETKSSTKIVKPKSVFELLDDEGMDIDLDSDIEGNDDEGKEKPDLTVPSEVESKKEEKGKKGRKEKKKKEDDEELERMLAEIELGDKKKNKPKQKEVHEEVEEKGITIVTEIPDDEDEKPKRKKKKKKEDLEQKESKTDELSKVEVAEGEVDEDAGTVKSAAQKKKEKKERDRQKKLAQKPQEKTKKSEVASLTEEKEIGDADSTQAVSGQLLTEQVSADGVDKSKSEEGDDDEDGKKKKGDKKKPKKEKEKEKEKEKDDKDKKRPGKRQILAMQEALKKLKEEEEKQRLDEEAKQKAADEAETLRLEKLRLEQERKERKKLKEKEKRERLKAEGKLLSQSQKQQRARAQAMLEALRAQGIAVPQIGEKKERTPRPGDRIRSKKTKQSSIEDQSKETTPELTSESAVTSTTKDNDKPVVATEETPAVESVPPKADVKETWEDESDADVKETWDDSSAEEDEEDDRVGVKKSTNKASSGKKKSSELHLSIEDSSGESGSESDGSDRDSEDESSSEETDSEEDEEEDQKPLSEKIRERALLRIQKRREDNEKNRSMEKLRSPVVCVLGHVDTGKTKILDKIRHTHVQDSEAGGITQQIGATMVPMEVVQEQSKMVKNFSTFESKIPGLLIIDTPGHESFSNLRSRGSSLCDIAILVVDIMHGLEPQTIESINLLKQKKTPFVVALNKIDRLYEWKPNKHKDVQDTLKSQNRNTQLEFDERVKSVVVQFAEQSLNATLFYENKDPRTFISLVPTSAHTGDGMGNLMALIVELTQTMMSKRITFTEELQATVLEVKAIPGLGTTIDVILVNGRLREGDTLVLAGVDGPLVTQIRSLLMPQPLKELRVKNPYQEYKAVEGSQGIKVTGKDLEKSIAGLNLLVAHHPDEVEICKEEVAKELQQAMSSIKLAERGVFVQASTLGSLEALLEFLRTSKIPYSGIRIGPVVKKDVMKASIMLEHDSQYAVILAFDVKIERDAQDSADNLGVKIFSADIIYHLFDKFMGYRDELKAKKRDQFKHVAVFPCKLRILPQFIFNSRDPIVVGVSVEAGVVKEGTPLCVPSRDFIDIGTVTTIELNHKSLECARKGQEVCIKIEPVSGETPKLYGRHFEHTDHLVSKISRQSIDACKEYFRDDLQKTDWQLMVELKKMFQIV